MFIYIYITQYVYTYYYIFVYILCLNVSSFARGLTFARNRQNFMRVRNLLCCFGACFPRTANMQNIGIVLNYDII